MLHCSSHSERTIRVGQPHFKIKIKIKILLRLPGQVISPSAQRHTPFTRDSVSSQSSVHVAGLVEEPWRPWC